MAAVAAALEPCSSISATSLWAASGEGVVGRRGGQVYETRLAAAAQFRGP